MADTQSAIELLDTVRQVLLETIEHLPEYREEVLRERLIVAMHNVGEAIKQLET